jgi:cytidylate kinase
MAREGGDFNEIRAYTAMRDREDTRRYLELYKIDNTAFEFADLVIDADLRNPEEIGLIILQRLIEKGLVIRG